MSLTLSYIISNPSTSLSFTYLLATILKFKRIHFNTTIFIIKHHNINITIPSLINFQQVKLLI